MSTPDSTDETTPEPVSLVHAHALTGAAAATSMVLPNFLPPARIVAQLSEVRATQPIAALAGVNQHQQELAEVFLQAIQRGVEDPNGSFAKEGMLFNYATYFLAKWRDRRAYPLFLRWFSLAGEDALELGGDTIEHHGSRFLASVWDGNIEPLKSIATNREANPVCRGQALRALGVLVAWGEWPRPEAENTLIFLAREGLERVGHSVWSDLALVCVQLEFISGFAELRRALQEGLLQPSAVRAEDLDQVEHAPRGALIEEFARRHPPITDVIQETRWWGGFRQVSANSEAPRAARVTKPYYSQPKVGRNDTCPCGSGKKYKKCCGA
ncbi:MAG: DUF1186 domain-containing protein [Verrucomicrobiota bacterium]